MHMTHKHRNANHSAVVVLISDFFPLLLIFNAKFHNKLLKAISGFLKRQAIDLHQIMIESSVHHQLTDKCILNTQLCSLWTFYLLPAVTDLNIIQGYMDLES